MDFISFHHTFYKYPITYITFIHILVLSKEMATSSDSTTNLASAVETNLSLTDNDLSDLIKIQGDIVRKLKAEKASKAQVYC
jgi:hypothetical protein